MSGKKLQVLFLGDICGQPGNRAVFIGLKQLIRDYRVDFVIANGENASDGFGITPEVANNLYAAGIDVLTSGNHIWQKDEILPLLKQETRLLRPHNYPPSAPGRGYVIQQVHGHTVTVINLQGRLQMSSIDCPFRSARELVNRHEIRDSIILIDFHAESSEEKEALALYLDGKVAGVVGTHTHIQTADERILPQGTAYITDLGMTGPVMGVIGSRPDISVERQQTQIPLRNKIIDAPAAIQGVVLTVDAESGRADSIERFSREMGF